MTLWPQPQRAFKTAARAWSIIWPDRKHQSAHSQHCHGRSVVLAGMAKAALVAALVILTGSAPIATAADTTTRSSSLNITIGGRSDPNVERLLPDYTMNYNRSERVVSLMKKDGSAKAFVQIMPAAAHLSTTKAYAQNIMDSYAGWGLTAQIARRGFSFRYVDNAPCAALLSYFDGTSYLLFGACGVISQDEMTKAFSIAKLQLGLDDITYRSSTPSAYY